LLLLLRMRLRNLGMLGAAGIFCRSLLLSAASRSATSGSHVSRQLSATAAAAAAAATAAAAADLA
jgi:hypothetical protein